MILNLAGDSKLNLPLEPMVWALAFGACLGGIFEFDTILKLSNISYYPCCGYLAGKWLTFDNQIITENCLDIDCC